MSSVSGEKAVAVSVPGTLVAGRYRLVKRVGSGGMGVVWEARDERLERSVALKELHSAPGLSEEGAELANSRAMREARITARLHHPHAVPVFDVVEHEGHPCLVMQYLPSRPLSAVLDERPALTADRVARIGAQIAAALSAAHDVGIVHRDVKPGNILISEDGTARISDFGISHALGDVTLTSSGMVTGTPAYLAPEIARGGDFSFASDVFSLGATLYTATEGEPPFGRGENSIALLHKVAAGRYPTPHRSGAMTPVLLRMLSSDPAARPPMSEVARTLEGLAAGAGRVDTTDDDTVPSAAGAPATEVFTERLGAPMTQRVFEPVTEPAAQPAAPRRRRSVAAVVIAAVVIAVGLAFVATHLWRAGPTDTAVTSRSGPATTSTGSSTSTSGTSAPSASSHTSSSARASSPTKRSSATSSSQSSVRPAGGSPSATELTRAVTDYYALMPSGTTAGYALLSSSYQAKHAGGLSGYRRFWSAIRGVTVSNTVADLPSKVSTTVTYHYKNGRVVVERTSFALVDVGGTLKINSSTVISSRDQ